MGMSASQARFLMLTAQKNNNEYQAQAITYERLQLTKYIEQLTLNYNDKMQNRVLLFSSDVKGAEENDQNVRLSYEAITKDYSSGGLGMRLVDKEGKIVTPFLPDPLYAGTTKDDYNLTPNIENPAFLEKGLREGSYFLEKRDPQAADGWSDIQWQGNGAISDSLDTSDDAIAQSEYDTKNAQFYQNDKMLELQLKKLNTEHLAIETEIDSVKKVIDKNIETSFKTFG